MCDASVGKQSNDDPEYVQCLIDAEDSAKNALRCLHYFAAREESDDETWDGSGPTSIGPRSQKGDRFGRRSINGTQTHNAR